MVSLAQSSNKDQRQISTTEVNTCSKSAIEKLQRGYSSVHLLTLNKYLPMGKRCFSNTFTTETKQLFVHQDKTAWKKPVN